jgi:hypothetical protein
MRFVQRLWNRFSWQVAAAILVSMISGFGYLENPWLDWLGWFGYVGGLVTVAIARFVPGVPLPLAFFVGFGMNVALWVLIFSGLGRLLAWLKSRPAADNHGV